ncbi:exoribonuclease II [Renibacterium salmoninarum ATCC 33209]|uniref:Exoribonuclease II n=1 Tax=Renibacterium salmoninarum (strain ATCC 33209 / DSM 20767 / JCM 11484 / NBRC 15589 / NCIMB 2235) TaxID=288705 RepID=A9WPJ7_RENSM|nr:RNB domain-containing ribonuclease [Renibacterium salmoninarum]ABY22942.1 exoribonuclease II [Renibacterium salmoninarum ATCC 33209]
MPHSHIFVRDSDQSLSEALAALRLEFELPQDFSPEVMAELEQSIKDYDAPTADLSQLGFITIDPPSSMDLDQAMFLCREGQGYRVYYAIADVPAFVPAGGTLDAETRKRGQTIYLPDQVVPLHPTKLSEAAASLLAQQRRGAFVWQIVLDASGKTVSAVVGRAVISSIAKLGYQQAQDELTAQTESAYLETLKLLEEIGLKRIQLERERGGASLNSPQQEIVHENGEYSLIFRPNLAIEDWNAQISLLTGMAAARIMLDGKIGILRTMPAPDPAAIAKFRHQAVALGKPWPAELAYGEFLRSLDAADPKQLALLHDATSLFRGAGYTNFDGELPPNPGQAAVAAPYAHTTAPLRRLVDRFVLTICDALSNNQPAPQWAREALPSLPALMAASDQLAGKVERAALDTIEAALLSTRVGQDFDAVVVAGARKSGGEKNGDTRCAVQLREPAVNAPCEGDLAPGTEVTVRLLRADIHSRKVLFTVSPAKTNSAG